MNVLPIVLFVAIAASGAVGLAGVYQMNKLFFQAIDIIQRQRVVIDKLQERIRELESQGDEWKQI